MTKLTRTRTLALLAALAIGGAGYAFAQGIINLPSPTGTERITVTPLAPGGGAGGYQAEININQIRNTSGSLLVGAGTTVNTTVPNSASKVIATGAISTAWNVTLPTAPADGQTVAIACTGGAAASLVVNVTGGPALVGTAPAATCTAGGAAPAGAEYVYSLAANTWYRVQ